jgi:putative ABC transport system permease protein
MKHVLYLAWRYLRYQWFKSLLLTASITLVIFLPAGLQVLVERSSQHLSARANATPLVLGARGSELELVLNTLYFESRRPETFRYSESGKLLDGDLAQVIPLYCGYSARQHPLVGTTLEYFEFRQLRLARGRMLSMLGECLVGSEVARVWPLEVGDAVISSPETMFDLGGVYPLKMNVVGILQPTGGPDDRAIFIDLKTAWIIEGLGHGHDDLADPERADQLLRREGAELTASAAVPNFSEITAENLDSFHFHGSQADFPITAAIVLPRDDKGAALLLGRYQDPAQIVQLVRPSVVIERLMETIFTVRRYLMIAALLVGVSTLLSVLLIFLLSLRLRQREIQTLTKIGASRLRIGGMLAAEVAMVLLASSLLATLMTFGVASWSESAIRWLLG